MSKTYVVELKEQDSYKQGWLGLLVLATFMTLWKLWLLAIIVYMLVRGGQRALAAYNNHRIVVDAENRALCRRADRENQLFVAGDPAGIEGDYPAYTMPITGYQVHLDDYDDGLRGWK